MSATATQGSTSYSISTHSATDPSSSTHSSTSHSTSTHSATDPSSATHSSTGHSISTHSATGSSTHGSASWSTTTHGATGSSTHRSTSYSTATHGATGSSTHGFESYTFGGSSGSGDNHGHHFDGQRSYEKYLGYFEKFRNQVTKWENIAKLHKQLHEWRKHIGLHTSRWHGHHHKHGGDKGDKD